MKGRVLRSFPDTPTEVTFGEENQEMEKKPLWVGTISITLFGYWLIVTSVMRALFVLIVPHLLQIPYEIIFTSGEGKQELGRKSKARLRDGTISITLVKLFCFPFSRLLLHPYEPRIIFFLGFAGWLLPLCLKLRKFSVVSFLLFFSSLILATLQVWYSGIGWTGWGWSSGDGSVPGDIRCAPFQPSRWRSSPALVVDHLRCWQGGWFIRGLFFCLVACPLA